MPLKQVTFPGFIQEMAEFQELKAIQFKARDCDNLIERELMARRSKEVIGRLIDLGYGPKTIQDALK